MIGRIVRYGAAALFIATLTHVATIVSIPSNAPRMAFDSLAAKVPFGRLTTLDRLDPPVAGLDPAFVNAVCLLGQNETGLRLVGTPPNVYWSVAVVADNGRVVSAATRDTQTDSTVDMAIVAAGARDIPPVDPKTVTVALPSGVGFFLVRAFVPTRNDRPAIEDALSALDCRPLSPQSS